MKLMFSYKKKTSDIKTEVFSKKNYLCTIALSMFW